jgi:gliding motility-associated-like protein
LNISPSVTIAPGNSATLHVSGAASYAWSPADFLSCATCDSPVVTSPSQNTRYCVVSNSGECPASACVDVFITCETNKDFSLPNAFTPNGDNNNDAFCLQGWNECTSDFRILIFDRWGEKVFESNDPSFCWDGIFRGQPLNSGVFVYVVHVKKFKGEVLDKRGNITLIR